MVLSPVFIFSYFSTGQEVGWKDRLQYDLYCVEWDVKSQLNQTINLFNVPCLCLLHKVVITFHVC